MSAAAVGRTGQAARLFMIGSEEEQEEVAPARPPDEERKMLVASFMGEGFRWKEFDAGAPE